MNRCSGSRWGLSLGAAALAFWPTTHYGDAVVHFGSGATPGEIATALDLFRADLGGVNNGVGGGPFITGFRTINWDGVGNALGGPRLTASGGEIDVTLNPLSGLLLTTFATDLAGPTGGRVDPAADAVFDPAPVRGQAEVGIWPWLVGLALALFLADVALRRLVLTAGDSAAWKSGFTPPKARGRKQVAEKKQEAEAGGQPPPTLSESETLQRLMRRKRG